MPIQPTADKNSEGFIEIYDEFAEGLSDLGGFSHIYLIFHLHNIKKSRLKVIPFLDSVERGIFATRSPSRPNPVGLSVVELMSVKENILRIRGVDILDGTPLIDIKPYVPFFEDTKKVRTGWLAVKEKMIPGRLSDGRFSE